MPFLKALTIMSDSPLETRIQELEKTQQDLINNQQYLKDKINRECIKQINEINQTLKTAWIILAMCTVYEIFF